MAQKESAENFFQIRRASRKDVAKLAEISRSCFPDYLEWCTLSQTQRWWNSIVDSHGCETWLYERNCIVCGFVRLITDPLDHQREKAKLRPRMMLLCFVFLSKPGLLKKKLSSRIRRLWQPLPHQGCREYQIRRSLWLHTIAVQPAMQGRGIGQEIMEFSEKRALTLGFDSIRLFVTEDNSLSIRFHQKIGYVNIGRMEDCLAFIKILDNPH